MAGIEDRQRSYVVDGAPVATGVVAVGDAWACTNPSVGRGCTIGIMHAEALRDVVRNAPIGDATGFALAWDAATRARVEPFVGDTLRADRHRLAEVEARSEGRAYEPDDREWVLGQAFAAASGQDPQLFRAFLETIALYERQTDVLARPGVTEQVLALGGAPGAGALPGPSHADLLALLAS
jgi:flavin-dependent dehydrogenase